jgi:uncharacterized protein YgiM (DUF1202 family)
MRGRMRRLVSLLLLLVACATPAPPPAPVTAPEPVVQAPEPVQQEERVIGTVRVTASSLNVRSAASTEAEVLVQVKRGTSLDVLSEDASWVKVRLASGERGWVAARFVSRGGESPRKRKAPRGKCPPDSDYAFDEPPLLAFSEGGAHGLVVVEANVNAQGRVTSTKLVSNATGDETLAFLAQKELRAATFVPPIRDCLPRAFVFTYRRTY